MPYLITISYISLRLIAMRKCSVSVIIPTYNRFRLLERAIRSVVHQTLQCSELIVVDDGSDDETEKLIEQFAKEGESNIVYIKTDNGGPAAARNIGIRRSQYNIVAFLDSDDHWHRKKLAIQYPQLLKNKEYLVSHTKEKWLRRGEHLNQKKKHIPQHGNIYEHCLQLCAVGMSTVMARTELFEKVGYFDESLPCCEDYDLWVRASHKYNFLLIDNPLTIKEGGRSDQVSYKFRQGMDKFRIRSLENLLGEEGLSEENYLLCLNEFSKKVKILGFGCIKHGKEELGRKYLSKIDQYRKIAVSRFPHQKKRIYDEF